MPLEFQLNERVCGMAMHSASVGEKVQVLTQELIGPTEAHLLGRLEELQRAVFSKIPGLPPPSTIDHLLLVIRQNLTGTAYVNELRIRVMVRVNRDVEAPVSRRDITDVASVDLGVPVPPDNGVIVVRSAGWRRSLFWDLGPLLPEHGPRDYPLEKVLAQQELLLLGLIPSPPAATDSTIQ
ncbi:MAG: hypothetical protein L0Z62_37560 [Gemmataceae bacterium]|nr:hypothetical protein [Gemmataceae bacterium]